MTERTTVRLPDDLIAKAKRKALAEGRSLTALIEEGLRRVVAEPAPIGPRRRKPIPISSATGGLVEGMSWEDFHALEAFEDIERLRRSP